MLLVTFIIDIVVMRQVTVVMIVGIEQLLDELTIVDITDTTDALVTTDALAVK
jgi:hypothetical protein